MSEEPVLWRASGRGNTAVVHVDRGCQALASAENLRTIPILYAKRAGSRLCRVCADGRPVEELDLDEPAEAVVG